MWRILMIVGWLSLGTAPALAQDRATIEKLNDIWSAAFNKGDAAAVAALYTEDAYVLRRARRWSRAAPRSRRSGGKRHSRWATRS